MYVILIPLIIIVSVLYLRLFDYVEKASDLEQKHDAEEQHH